VSALTNLKIIQHLFDFVMNTLVAYIILPRLNISTDAMMKVPTAVSLGRSWATFLLPTYVSSAPAHPMVRRLSMSIHAESLKRLP